MHVGCAAENDVNPHVDRVVAFKISYFHGFEKLAFTKRMSQHADVCGLQFLPGTSVFTCNGKCVRIVVAYLGGSSLLRKRFGRFSLQGYDVA